LCPSRAPQILSRRKKYTNIFVEKVVGHVFGGVGVGLDFVLRYKAYMPVLPSRVKLLGYSAVRLTFWGWLYVRFFNKHCRCIWQFCELKCTDLNGLLKKNFLGLTAPPSFMLRMGCRSHLPLPVTCSSYF